MEDSGVCELCNDVGIVKKDGEVVDCPMCKTSAGAPCYCADERGMLPCPCGKHPTELVITKGQCSKWAFVYGDCCAEWMIEFRTQYLNLDSNECMALALKAWNAAPRAAQ